jgi:hypothetical protein
MSEATATRHWSMLLGPCKHGKSPVTRCDEEDCPEANAFEQYLREYSEVPPNPTAEAGKRREG